MRMLGIGRGKVGRGRGKVNSEVGTGCAIWSLRNANGDIGSKLTMNCIWAGRSRIEPYIYIYFFKFFFGKEARKAQSGY